MNATNAHLQNLQAKMAYDQQRINIRANVLQLALSVRQTITSDGTSESPVAKSFTASDLVEDARKMEEYIFADISSPGESSKLVRATSFPPGAN